MPMISKSWGELQDKITALVSSRTYIPRENMTFTVIDNHVILHVSIQNSFNIRFTLHHSPMASTYDSPGGIFMRDEAFEILDEMFKHLPEIGIP